MPTPTAIIDWLLLPIQFYTAWWVAGFGLMMGESADVLA